MQRRDLILVPALRSSFVDLSNSHNERKNFLWRVLGVDQAIEQGVVPFHGNGGQERMDIGPALRGQDQLISPHDLVEQIDVDILRILQDDLRVVMFQVIPMGSK